MVKNEGLIMSTLDFGELGDDVVFDAALCPLHPSVSQKQILVLCPLNSVS